MCRFLLSGIIEGTRCFRMGVMKGLVSVKMLLPKVAPRALVLGAVLIVGVELIFGYRFKFVCTGC